MKYNYALLLEQKLYHCKTLTLGCKKNLLIHFKFVTNYILQIKNNSK